LDQLFSLVLKFWYNNGEIAVCQKCSKEKSIEDLPTKKEWLELSKKGNF
jgi:hypothetical protein